MNVDTDLIKLLNYFEDQTGARVKDCFYDNLGTLTFIVEQGDLGKALGKGARNLKRLQDKLDKKVRIAEYKPNKQEFILSLVAPLEVEDIEERPDGVVVLKGGDRRTNGLLIGKKARNLRNLEWMVRKFFEVPEIRVE